MRRLHFGLRKEGVDSRILCVRGVDKSPNVIVSKPSWIESRWNAHTERITVKYGLEDLLSLSALRIKLNKYYLDADVIHLHRIPNVFSYLAFPLLTRNKPAVWTLHEMWSFTGHCRQSLDCERWKIGCGKCPYPHLAPAIKKDGTHLQWKLKNSAFSHSNLTCVAPSKWLTDLAHQSMIKQFPVYHIPHGIDTNVYKPLDKERCRAILNIPAHKNVIMFVAQRLETFIKGGDLLLKALKKLPEALKNKSILLVFGRNGERIADALDIQTVNMGYIVDDRIKAQAYSAADVFLCPSRAESFCNVVLESMACGTPTVACRVSALPDLVRPGITGYLAEPENVEDFCSGVVQLLEDHALRSRMSEQCRKIVTEEYTQELMFRRYSELYQKILSN